MSILETYLNEFRRLSSQKERDSISNKMTKYLIGSCFKKMCRRAFDWPSSCMIGSLTSTDWRSDAPKFPSGIAIKPDARLSKFLRTATSSTEGGSTFGEWVMTYHPFKSGDNLPSLDDFLNFALGPSEYEFDGKIADIFLDLFLSSVYAYLSLMKRLRHYIKAKDQKNIQKCVGPFSNAIRIFYLVSHSNAMKVYFAHTSAPLAYPSPQASVFYKHRVDSIICKQLGWGREDVVPEDNRDWDEDWEDREREENYVEDFKLKDPDIRLIYRRSFMSFVDHYAALRLLERRSLYLPKDEAIKLSLVAVKDPAPRYFPWEEMEKVILKTCQDFRGSTTSSHVQVRVEGQDMIDKIKEHLGKNKSSENTAIKPFITLLQLHDRGIQLVDSQYPSFPACIHCESSLAAILYQLHSSPGQDGPSDLHNLFQVCPFLTRLTSLPHL